MTAPTSPARPRAGREGHALQRVGGFAALYAVCGYLAAIPYFVVWVDYPGTVDPVEKVALLRDHRTSLYLMHLLSFEVTALALILVSLAVQERLRPAVPAWARVGAVVGIVRSGLLLASVMVFDYGMDRVVDLSASAPDRAVATWQAIEPVADALGGSGGEVMGGLWVLLVSAAALRATVFPAAMNWLGLAAGGCGVLSAGPGASALEVAFGLLQIVWLLCLGVALLRDRGPAPGGAQ